MKKTFLPCLLAVLTIAGQAQMRFDTSSFVRNNANLWSIVVSKNDSVIYKRFFNGKIGSDQFNNQSLTKSVVSLLVGIAIEKGYIKSVNQKIVDFFPLLKTDTDKRKQDITILDIMNQASGLWHENLDSAGGVEAYLAMPDPSGYVLQHPLLTEPSKVFHYSNAASHLLSVILTKATHMSTLQFAEQYLFKPLHITAYNWEKMKDGYYDGSGLLSLHLRTDDMLKIGNLLLNKGMYNSKQVVPAIWVEQILHPRKTYHTEWGIENSLYALFFYHVTYRGHYIVYGMGWGGQFVMAVPGLHAVICVNQNHETPTAVRQSISFTSKILPLILKGLE